MMSRTEHNYWLDVTNFAAFLITTITGILLWLVFPHQWDVSCWGFSRSAWVSAHVCFGVAGIAGIIIHIIRHRGWLRALRGRPLHSLPEKLRVNRIVDRVMWITYIAANTFGAIAWVLHFGDDMDIVRVPDRLHAGFGVAFTILVFGHLALHWKWIVSTTRRHIQINFRDTNDLWYHPSMVEATGVEVTGNHRKK